MEVQVTELAHDGSQDEPGFWFPGDVAVVVFTKCDFNQWPKKPAAIIIIIIADVQRLLIQLSIYTHEHYTPYTMNHDCNNNHCVNSEYNCRGLGRIGKKNTSS